MLNFELLPKRAPLSMTCALIPCSVHVHVHDIVYICIDLNFLMVHSDCTCMFIFVLSYQSVLQVYSS